MSRKNDFAKDLRSPKYRKRITKNKVKYDRNREKQLVGTSETIFWGPPPKGEKS